MLVRQNDLGGIKSRQKEVIIVPPPPEIFQLAFFLLLPI